MTGNMSFVTAAMEHRLAMNSCPRCTVSRSRAGGCEPQGEQVRVELWEPSACKHSHVAHRCATMCLDATSHDVSGGEFPARDHSQPSKTSTRDWKISSMQHALYFTTTVGWLSWYLGLHPPLLISGRVPARPYNSCRGHGRHCCVLPDSRVLITVKGTLNLQLWHCLYSDCCYGC
jgi:hypothetical protein